MHNIRYNNQYKCVDISPPYTALPVCSCHCFTRIFSCSISCKNCCKKVSFPPSSPKTRFPEFSSCIFSCSILCQTCGKKVSFPPSSPKTTTLNSLTNCQKCGKKVCFPFLLCMYSLIHAVTVN